MRVPLFHVNAFTNQLSAGNPAAVCLLDFWLDDGLLRKVAAENNLSATAFLVSAAEGYDIRWFTPRCEIQLCGHATLAATYVVLKLLSPERESLTFLTRFRGNLRVSRQDERFSMDLPAEAAKHCVLLPELLQALGSTLQRSDIVETSHANDTYVVVLKSETEVRRVRPDFGLLEKLHPSVVTITAQGDDSDFVYRHFAPSYGIPEDSVTGSAQCLLAPYWSSRLGKKDVYSRQLSARGGELWCEVASNRVLVKGEAVLTMKGSLQY